MKNDPTLNHAMACFHRSTVAISSLTIFLFASFANAANPPVSPSNPVGFTTVTTPYSSTTSPPQISHIPPKGVPNVGGGSSYPVPPTRPVTPIVSNGGFNAPARGGITIEGIKSPPIPTSGTANYPKPTVNNAAKSLLRNNLASLVLGAGLQALLNGIGALIDEGGNVVRRGDPSATLSDGNFWRADPAAHNGVSCDNPNLHNALECSGAAVLSTFSTAYVSSGVTCTVEDNKTVCSQDYSIADGVVIRVVSATAPFVVDLDYDYVPVPPSVIDDAVDDSYNPDPSDFDNLTPYMFPQS